nr:hypothetical protein [Tanacetum cinerariifolium]
MTYQVVLEQSWRTLLKKTTLMHNTFFLMDSQSTSIVSTTKLPILNPNEFDLWKMRIEQKFLRTDYSLWEVIINGDSPTPTVVIEGAVRPATILSADQKLARRNELKARGTLLMALPDKHQLKFNSHKDAKTLMEAIKKRFGGNTKTKKKLVSQLEIHRRNKANLEEHSLDDLFNSLKIYETEVRHSSSPGNPTQNLAFVLSSNTDSTTDSVSAATSVSAICGQLRIDVDDLEEMDLRWQMAMLTIRARRFLQKTGRNLGDNRVTTMGFDMSKVECYNYHRMGHVARECRSPKDTRRTSVAEPQRTHVPVETSTSNALVSQCDGIESYDWSYQAEEEPANFALMAIPSSSSASGNEVKSCSKACSKAYDELHSQYDKLTVEIQPNGGYHVIPPPITGNFMPPKPDLVFHTAPIAVETTHSASTVQLSPAKPVQDFPHTTRPMAPIIEDWVFDTKDESEPNDSHNVLSFVQPTEHVKPFGHSDQLVEAPILAATPKPTSPKTNCSSKRKNRKTCFVCRSVDHLIKDLLTKSKPVYVTTARPVSAAVPKIMTSRPRHTHSLNTKSNSTIRRHKTQNQFSKTNNSSSKVTVAKASVVNAVKGKKGKWVWRPKCPILDLDSRTTGNMSYLFDFQELNGRYVAFGGNPKGGKISGKGKIKTVDSLGCFSWQLRMRLVPPLRLFSLALKIILASREFSVPRTPQQNGIVERKNRTLIEAARTMLADSLLPVLFWVEAVNTACYVQNRVLVTKPHNKTPYELLHGRTPSIGFMRPFGCPLTILNTLDSLGKFKGKVDEGFLVGYSVNSKAFRVFSSRTHIVQETLHVNFLENKPNVAGTGPTWLFDIDSLIRTMNYQPVTAGNQTNPSVGFQETFNANKVGEEANQQYMLFPIWSTGSLNPQNKERDAAFDEKEHDAKKPKFAVNLSPSSSALSGEQDNMTKKKDKGKSHVEYFTGHRDLNADFKDYSEDSSNDVSAAGPIVPTVGQNYSNITNPISAAGPSNSTTCPTHGKSSLRDVYQSPDMIEREDIAYSDHENVGIEADFNNLETSIIVGPIPTTRTHNAHPISQIISNLSSTTQTRSMTRVIKDQGGLLQIFNDDFHTCMFVCFLSQEEPKRVHQALKDPSWIKAMQEELLQFKMQKVWILVDLPHGKRAIGHTQKEGIDYEEVFAPVARIEAIRLFLAYASFMGFMVYQMDVKSAFMYVTIEEEVYVCQPPGFEDPDHPDKVYKVVKAIYGLHQASRAWYETLANYLLENGFHRGQIDQTLLIKKQKGDQLLVQIYVDDIIFGATNKDLCKSFEKLMKDKFQMSSMGELTFFLGLQVNQKKDG